jgi:hypothetical protein
MRDVNDGIAVIAHESVGNTVLEEFELMVFPTPGKCFVDMGLVVVVVRYFERWLQVNHQFLGWGVHGGLDESLFLTL